VAEIQLISLGLMLAIGAGLYVYGNEPSSRNVFASKIISFAGNEPA
jgi:hypothetical protein